MTAGLEAGFADPVPDAQRCFRARARRDGASWAYRPRGGRDGAGALGTAAAAVVLTLVDHETPLWLDADAAAARAWIEFHCGAKDRGGSGAVRFRGGVVAAAI